MNYDMSSLLIYFETKGMRETTMQHGGKRMRASLLHVLLVIVRGVTIYHYCTVCVWCTQSVVALKRAQALLSEEWVFVGISIVVALLLGGNCNAG